MVCCWRSNAKVQVWLSKGHTLTCGPDDRVGHARLAHSPLARILVVQHATWVQLGSQQHTITC